MSKARNPQAKSTHGKIPARKDWRAAQGPDTYPLLVGWWYKLPLFPEANTGSKEGEVKRRNPERKSLNFECNNNLEERVTLNRQQIDFIYREI